MIITVLFAYLIGSIPFGKIITKILINKDITQTGSGNIGATNVYRSVSKKAGILVLILDAIKPIIVLAIIQYLNPNLYNEYKYIFFLVSIIGHIFPIWLKFKGGKGVATYLGVILALSYKFFLIFGITWLVLSFLFRYASLSSIISSLIVFVYSYFFINSFSLILFIFFVIIIYTHRENIVRLKNSEESKIKL